MRLSDAYPDIQASILASHGEVAVYHFLAIEDAETFRAAVKRELACLVTTEEDRRATTPEIVLGLGLTFGGLVKLGVPPSVLAELPDAFADGMANRADLLGDGGESDPVHWEPPFGTDTVDLAIWLWGEDAALIEERWRKICGGGDAPPGTARVGRSQGRVLWNDARSYRVEPFGFREGISQPRIDTGVPGDPPGIAPGEFVLGFPSEAERELTGPRSLPTGAVGAARELERNGSYMVFRKIQQFPRRFAKFILDSSVDPEDGELLKAELFGRWPNGALLRGPEEPPASDENEFRFGDPGVGCPRGSHIRRANPRDDGPERIADRHRILRRGIPYEEGREVGLLFVCFNARIDDQFELIQSRWLNSGNFSRLPSDHSDSIAGSAGSSRPIVKRLSGELVAVGEALTRVRGGEYLLVPGRAALEELCQGFPSEIPAPSKAASDLFEPTPELVREVLKGRPVARPIGDTGDNVWFVGTHSGVRAVLEDGASYTIDPYRTRIHRAIRTPLMISTSDLVPEEVPIRRARIAFLEQVVRPQVDRILIASIAKSVLSRIGPGLHEVVDEIARAVPLAVAEHYLGVRDDSGEPSPTAIAAHFGRTPPLPVPPEWEKKRREQLQRSGIPVGTHNLAFWTRILFLETFVNLYEAAEPKAFAREAGREFIAHLEALAARGPRLDTVYRRALEEDPELAKWLVLELAVGGTDTVTMAITNLFDVLLSRRDAMEAARAAVRTGAGDDRLDRLIVECLRLDPPAGLLLRRCGPAGATIEGQRIAPGSPVGVLVAAACLDPRVFGPNPLAFDPDRDPGKAPVFGAGSHYCRGDWIALTQLREVLRWLFSSQDEPRFARLRRAPGPRGRKVTRNRLPHSMYVWLDGDVRSPR